MVREPRRKNRSAAPLEDIQSDVRKFAEGHSTLVRSQQEFRTEIVQLNLRVEQLEHAIIEGFKNVRTSVDALTKRFVSHEQAHASIT